ncbi:efflux RND transporter permease subunit, partial [Acinetobacter baumannii]
YFARQQINERLATASLPEGMPRPTLGPIATGLGEVFHYVLRGGEKPEDLVRLRTVQDWVIKPQLRLVPGVTEINTIGGFASEYLVAPSAE